MSKISVHILDVGSGPAAEFVRRTRPAFAKFANELGQAREMPGVTAIGRVVAGTDADLERWMQARTPVQAATEFVNNQFPAYHANPHIRVWEGPNEPNITTPGLMHWYGAFEFERAKLMERHGLKAVIGNFSVGTPQVELWPEFRWGFEGLKQFGGWLGLHEYQEPPGTPGSPDGDAWAEHDWGWYFLRCAKAHAQASRMGFSPRILITECGMYLAWQGRFSAEQYADWLAVYDRHLAALPFVDGAFIFTSGREWNGFGVDGNNGEVLRRLADRVQAWPVPQPTPPRIWEVRAGALNIRSGPGILSRIVGVLRRGERVRELESRLGWIRHDRGGWSSSLPLYMRRVG